MNSTFPTATHTSTRVDSEPSTFIFPNLLDDFQYPLRQNPHCDPVSRASEQWLLNGARLVEPESTAFLQMDAGALTAACYPDADALHFRVCVDFLNFIFTIDDWMEFGIIDARGARESCISALRDPINFHTEELAAKMCKSYFSRFKMTGGPGCTERFIQAMDLFFIALAQQVDDHAQGRTLDLKSYITLRRDTVCCKGVFALIEYAAQIDLPGEVVSHPVFVAMEEAANDHLSWVNDIFSYNKEQSRHDTHNIVPVLMLEQGLDLQGAADYTGRLIADSVKRFEDNRGILPLWGEEIDKQVALYVEGLQNWMVGSLHWHYDCLRYAGENGHVINQDQTMKLLPKTAL
ncbi:isoprenoid synthase domain-containing protein [Suillus lakei]|nr:isoprenoid synthase domain-containing protein [Suillus lakei]